MPRYYAVSHKVSVGQPQRPPERSRLKVSYPSDSAQHTLTSPQVRALIYIFP